jgi:hypothetical protein
MLAPRTCKLLLLVVTAVVAACAAEPPAYRDVVTVKAGQMPPDSAYPPPGTVWRLEENDLKRLSPAPFVEPPPPPRLPPPPRPDAAYPPPPGYSAPPPYWYGPGYYWRGW